MSDIFRAEAFNAVSYGDPLEFSPRLGASLVALFGTFLVVAIFGGAALIPLPVQYSLPILVSPNGSPATLASHIDGRILQTHVLPGARIFKGETILTIRGVEARQQTHSPEMVAKRRLLQEKLLRLALLKAEIEAEKTRSIDLLKERRARLAASQQSLEATLAARERVALALQARATDLQRLLAKGFATRAQYDEYRLRAEEASIVVEETRSNIALTQLQSFELLHSSSVSQSPLLRELISSWTTLGEQVLALQAELEPSTEAIEAPFDGVLVAYHAVQGQDVSAGMATTTVIPDEDGLVGTFNAPFEVFEKLSEVKRIRVIMEGKNVRSTPLEAEILYWSLSSAGAGEQLDLAQAPAPYKVKVRLKSLQGTPFKGDWGPPAVAGRVVLTFTPRTLLESLLKNQRGPV